VTAYNNSHVHAGSSPEPHKASLGAKRDYAIGFALSVVLTAIPFWLVMTDLLGATATALLVTLLAVLQIFVHTIFFLHVNTRSEGGWTLVSLLFTAVMVLIVIAGSLWIMFHLHGNMMPMAITSLPVPQPSAPAP
jgi:cytochrome o ubiquinol oxidase operon protein cyoD